MNEPRRKALRKIQYELEDISQRLQDLIDEEQEAFDNMPESIQGSERGEAMDEAISNLEYIRYNVDEVSSSIADML